MYFSLRTTNPPLTWGVSWLRFRIGELPGCSWWVQFLCEGAIARTGQMGVIARGNQTTEPIVHKVRAVDWQLDRGTLLVEMCKHLKVAEAA